MIDEEIAKEIAFYYGRSLPDTMALLKLVCFLSTIVGVYFLKL